MEARFLASQAERLADNKRRLQKSREKRLSSSSHGNYHQQSTSTKDNYFLDDAPNLCGEEDETKDKIVDTTNSNNDDQHHRYSQKEEGHRFWMNFRKLCSELQTQIDSLLLVVVTPDDDEGGAADNNVGGGVFNNNHHETAKAYYSTAARRNEGRTKLDCILENVRLLRRHCLSSSSSSVLLPTTTTTVSASNNDNDTTTTANNQLLLLSSMILSTPMPEMTQTDVRLLSEEIDRLLKCIDAARDIISPKEKFVFKRYRKAMEEKRVLLGGGERVSSSSLQPSKIDGGDIHNEASVVDNDDDDGEDKETIHHDGGVLENKSDCIIEIFPDGNIQTNKATQSQIQYYSLPRSMHSLHPPTFNSSSNTQHHNTSSSSGSSMSYLLQNLTNVTILLHGSRPTLHIKNIHNCHIYVTEPTLGPVHLTNCHSSHIRCSCYQLRIHDSIHVKFHVWVRSGPIIENCKEMVFEGDYYYLGGDDENGGGGGGKNMYWDVKDFNWLRTLRKSPNFVVVTAAAAAAASDEKHGLKEKGIVSGKEGVATAEVSDQMSLQEEEEDSEDEL